jgi:hypothetical protein
MMSVEEINYMPEFIGKVEEETSTAAWRFHKVLQRANGLAEKSQIELHTHVIAGDPIATSSNWLPNSRWNSL